MTEPPTEQLRQLADDFTSAMNEAAVALPPVVAEVIGNLIGFTLLIAVRVERLEADRDCDDDWKIADD